MPFLQRDGRQIYYVREQATPDKQNAETIVLIHTNVMDHSIYDRLSALLREEYDVIRYDLAGFGQSDLGEQELTLDLHVADFSYLMDALQLQSFHVMAIGLGGIIALAYNGLHRGRIQRMVLMSMPCFPEDTLQQVFTHRKKISQDGTFIPARNILKKTTLLDEDDPEFQRLYEAMIEFPVTTYMKMMELTLSANTIHYLRNHDLPTLVLAGEREIVFPQHWLAVECALLPHYRYTVVPNSSSFLMVDQPEITALLAKAFFKASTEPDRYRDEDSVSIFNHIHQYARRNYDIHELNARTKPVNRITIDLIHSFRLTLNGTPVKENLNQRYARNILVYLLFHPTTNRDDLCGNLWPNDSVYHARKNLRVYLSYLKKILNPYALSEPVLQVDRDSVQLTGELNSDVLDLLSALGAAALLKDPESKYAFTRRILDSFNTPNFLTSIHDQWFLEIRARIEMELVGLAIWTGVRLAEQGNEQEGLHYLTKALALTADNIKVYDALIDLYGRLNNETQQQFWIREKAKAWGTPD